MASIVSDSDYAVVAAHVIGMEKAEPHTLIIHLGPAGGLAASVMTTINYRFETQNKRNKFYTDLLEAIAALP